MRWCANGHNCCDIPAAFLCFVAFFSIFLLAHSEKQESGGNSRAPTATRRCCGFSNRCRVRPAVALGFVPGELALERNPVAYRGRRLLRFIILDRPPMSWVSMGMVASVAERRDILWLAQATMVLEKANYYGEFMHRVRWPG